MATPKQLSFIKAICNELGLKEPKGDIPTWEASSFISKYSAKFYLKKAKDKENRLKKNSNSRNYNHESSFKADAHKGILGMTTEQNVENIKNALRHCRGLDSWTGEKR